ncbi:nucleoside diphosphate kinase [Meredithblackwellia eburnea MCA 4105]
MGPKPSAKPLQLTLGIIKPSVYACQPNVQDIMKTIKASGLDIVRSKRVFWSEKDAEEFYGEHKGRFYFPRLHASSGPFLALALSAPTAIPLWRSLIGPTHVYKGQWKNPETLRARYGQSDTRNGFHGSDSEESARKELGQVFEGWDTVWWLERERARIAGELD